MMLCVFTLMPWSVEYQDFKFVSLTKLSVRRNWQINKREWS